MRLLRIKPNTNKWLGLGGETYEIEDLGRSAIFLLPLNKLGIMVGGETIEKNLHRFLDEKFGAFTAMTSSKAAMTIMGPCFGFWRNSLAELVYDECRLYEVSFAGKERIPLLLEKLTEVMRAIGEKCIYFKAGQYACLVYPK